MVKKKEECAEKLIGQSIVVVTVQRVTLFHLMDPILLLLATYYGLIMYCYGETLLVYNNVITIVRTMS